MSYSNTTIFIINFYFQRDNISIEIYITEIHYSFIIQDYLGNVNSQLFTKIMAIHRITSEVFHYLSASNQQATSKTKNCRIKIRHLPAIHLQ